MTPDPSQLATAEFLDIHAQCDKAGVPRRAPEGDLLSAAQRVSILTGAWLQWRPLGWLIR